MIPNLKKDDINYLDDGHNEKKTGGTGGYVVGCPIIREASSLVVRVDVFSRGWIVATQPSVSASFPV